MSASTAHLLSDCYYENLNLSSRQCELKEIKRNYRKLALLYHPDRQNTSTQSSETYFKVISQAYQVLSDPELRAVYDRYGKSGLDNPPNSEHNATASPHRSHHSSRAHGHHGDVFFDFQSPEELFRDFFGKKDPFFSQNHHQGHSSSVSSAAHRNNHAFDGFGSIHDQMAASMGFHNTAFGGHSSRNHGDSFFDGMGMSSNNVFSTSSSTSTSTNQAGQTVTRKVSTKKTNGVVETTTQEFINGQCVLNEKSSTSQQQHIDNGNY